MEVAVGQAGLVAVAATVARRNLAVLGAVGLAAAAVRLKEEVRDTAALFGRGRLSGVVEGVVVRRKLSVKAGRA